MFATFLNSTVSFRERECDKRPGVFSSVSCPRGVAKPFSATASAFVTRSSSFLFLISKSAISLYSLLTDRQTKRVRTSRCLKISLETQNVFTLAPAMSQTDAFLDLGRIYTRGEE